MSACDACQYDKAIWFSYVSLLNFFLVLFAFVSLDIYICYDHRWWGGYDMMIQMESVVAQLLCIRPSNNVRLQSRFVYFLSP
jgi:hypothetical protein